MEEHAAVDDVLVAAKSAGTTFDAVPEDPIAVDDPRDIGLPAFRRIVERYERHGFAILQLDPRAVSSGTVLELAAALRLGEAFVPPLYQQPGAQAPSVSRIAANANAGTADADHPSFGSSGGRPLHCDGTLQPIGYIRTSILLCESTAAEGGDTVLFNATGAFADLAGADPQAALALAVPGVLERRANVNGSTDVNTGPAFAVAEGRLVCCYSVSETDHWAVPDGVAEADLRRGVDFLADGARAGGRHHVTLRLDDGQAIVFDNTRISHGRTPYRDSPSRRRCLYRSLHLVHPRLPEGTP